MTHEIVIEPDGQIRMIYTDELRDLIDEGVANIRRGGFVEPMPDGTWSVDLSPVGGGLTTGFRMHEAAVKYEVEWLKSQWLI